MWRARINTNKNIHQNDPNKILSSQILIHLYIYIDIWIVQLFKPVTTAQ